MIIKISNYIIAFSWLSVLVGCGGNQSNEAIETSNDQDIVKTKTQITLAEINSPEFPEAVLELNEPLEGANYESGKIARRFLNLAEYCDSGDKLEFDQLAFLADSMNG